MHEYRRLVTLPFRPFLEKTATLGVSDLRRCASYYNAMIDSGSYVNFYACDTEAYVVCERNATAVPRV